MELNVYIKFAIASKDIIKSIPIPINMHLYSQGKSSVHVNTNPKYYIESTKYLV